MMFFMKENLFGHLWKVSSDFKRSGQVTKTHPSVP